MQTSISGIPSTSWFNLYNNPNISSTYAYSIENISSVDIYISLNTIPSIAGSNLIRPNEVFFISKGQTSVNLLTVPSGTVLGKVTVTTAYNDNITSALRKVDRLIEPRILTANLSQIELASVAGRLYYYNIDTTIAANSETWVSVTCPANFETAISFYSFVPFYTGFELKTYVNSTGMTLGASLPIISANRAFGVASTTTANYLTGAPTTVGTLRGIPVFVPVSGTNPNQRPAGNPSSATGFEIHPKGGNYQLRMITSSGNSNRIVGAIYWLESGATIIDNF